MIDRRIHVERQALQSRIIAQEDTRGYVREAMFARGRDLFAIPVRDTVVQRGD